ncbi:uncharacterized protein TNCV_121731 [Trichonephila clavipes]|nr:uncharacterized protein TNCV_121731 [Trichonephila clavipes]
MELCPSYFCDMLPNCEPKCGAGETLMKNGNCDCCGYCVNVALVAEDCTDNALPSLNPNTRYNMCNTGYKCDHKTRKCVPKD